MSTSTSLPGTLEAWEAAGDVQMVAMDDVQFLDFQQMPAIGTGQLGSCSVVVIASAQGAILAHIPPQPRPTNNPTDGDTYVRSMMNRISRLYREKQQRYFLSADTVVVCAVFRGEVALPSQLDIMMLSLHGLGLTPKIISYEVPGNAALQGKGTVIVTKKRHQIKPKIFVEEGLVNI